jgi:hypothetical protein
MEYTLAANLNLTNKPCCPENPCQRCYGVSIDAEYSFEWSDVDPETGVGTTQYSITKLKGEATICPGDGNTTSIIKDCITEGYIRSETAENALCCGGNLAFKYIVIFDLCDEEETCSCIDFIQEQHFNKVGGSVAVGFTPTLLENGKYSFSVDSILFESEQGNTWSKQINARNTGILEFTQDFSSPQSITLYNQIYGANITIGSASFSGTMDVGEIVCSICDDDQ